ncbi:MAG: Fic family protein [Bacteroidia bacterium]|nr:Fic family protein [Bacteroidia bacterium]
MNNFNWQHKDWPDFKFELTNLEKYLFSFYERIGHVSGILQAIPEDMQTETLLEIMVAEAVKTSEIEGEFLSRKDVMSSIKKNLGLITQTESKDIRTSGISSLMIDVRNSFGKPLTEQSLFDWHTMLLSHVKGIEIGKWRTHPEPMQVVSGALGKEKVHYEAPPSNLVPKEMGRFIGWFNDTAPGGSKEIKSAPVRSAIAHLYFESIHPFEDGNGRIGRAIAEKALSQGIGRPVMLSLSKTIESNKKKYYLELEKAQYSLEINSWLKYFVETILEAQIDSENQIEFTLKKVKFFDRFNNLLNDRHKRVIKRMLEEGPNGFTGGMNAKKYGDLCKISKATATRDLQYLLETNALIVSGGGRSTSYSVNL